MEELLSKIYDRIVIYEKDCISLGTEFDQKVAEKLEPMKESISEDELEKLKELIYWAAFLEEKDGFRLGVRFTLKLLVEILLPEEQSWPWQVTKLPYFCVWKDRKGGDSNGRIVYSGSACIDISVPSVEEGKVTIKELEEAGLDFYKRKK